MNKTEYKKLEDSIKYLMKKSKCTRVQAVLALVKNGKLKGSFSDTVISEVLGITYTQTIAASLSAEYKLKEVLRRRPDLKYYISDADAKNYNI